MSPDQIAKVCHETIRTFCQATDDNSPPPWEELPDRLKQTAVNGVVFYLNNPGALPSRSHEAWVEQMRRQGWKHGLTENPERKEHPYFLPYDELPAIQQAKHALFYGVVDALRRLADQPEPMREPA